ncbi:MAG: hypothetical protein JF606_03935 [Burkholderiales bacterium]|jgi:peptidoglycan/xylan/chitin deacetylase (PgdA/CDA1 family)|nr:hypothetical protein [Burkholderiales bacterium]
MLRVIFTLDYEIHGNGQGCPHALMVEPTERLLRLFDEYGAKLTILADVAEIMKFKEYKDVHGRDTYHYEAIAEQLRRAIETGHDVQLHIHSSYFNARIENGRWAQDWSEYDFASLPYERMDWMIRTGKQFLENLLRPVDPNYRCVAFRAANWSVSPSRNVVLALVGNGIEIDTSVFKYGRRSGIVNFDYSHAHSAIVPWPVHDEDICVRNDDGALWEVPIYSERRWLGAFATPGRVHRALSGWRHRLAREAGSTSDSDRAPPSGVRIRWVSVLLKKHAWKADFNQCSGQQLINALHRAARSHDSEAQGVLPFVLIGHSKLFTLRNERTVRPFLAHSLRHPERFGFGTLSRSVLPCKPGVPA